MAGNTPGDNSGNILVDFEYNNIIVVDPNKTIDVFGNIRESIQIRTIVPTIESQMMTPPTRGVETSSLAL
jgi:hypothetical protein